MADGLLANLRSQSLGSQIGGKGNPPSYVGGYEELSPKCAGQVARRNGRVARSTGSWVAGYTP
jgi:hypothetical protein